MDSPELTESQRSRLPIYALDYISMLEAEIDALTTERDQAILERDQAVG